MSSKRVHFDNGRGERLAARLDVPVDETPLAFALFAHCFTCSKDFKAVANIARALNQARIGVLRFDFTGLGQSEGEFAEQTFSRNLDDLVAAADYLATYQQAPAILIGHSLGGAAVLHAARRIASAQAVVTLAAPSSPEHVTNLLGEDGIRTLEQDGAAEISIGGRPFMLRREFVEDLRAQAAEEAIREMRKPLLVLHSPRDRIVDIEHARRIFEAAKHPKSFVSLDPADHLLSEPADSRYAGQIIAAWSARYLDAETLAQAKRQDAAQKRTVAQTDAEAGMYTNVLAGGYALVVDEPASHGGTDLGPTPYELLAAALASCTTITLQLYARRKKWPLNSVIARVSHDKVHAEDCEHCETAEGKIDVFERRLELQGNELSDEQRERLLEIANKCPVHRTLESEIRVTTELE